MLRWILSSCNGKAVFAFANNGENDVHLACNIFSLHIACQHTLLRDIAHRSIVLSLHAQHLASSGVVASNLMLFRWLRLTGVEVMHVFKVMIAASLLTELPLLAHVRVDMYR